jgi:hypothetical protein
VQVDRYLNTILPEGAAPITRSQFVEKFVELSLPRGVNLDKFPETLVEARLNAEGALHSLAYAFGAVRFDGDKVVRTGREVIGPRRLNPGDAPTAYSGLTVHLIDENGNDVSVPVGPKADAERARIKRALRVRRIESIRRDLAEAGEL